MGACSDWKRLVPGLRDDDDKGLEEFRRCFVEALFGEEVAEARRWIMVLREALEEVVGLVGARAVLLPKELKSFINDPLHHLMKKIFIYSHDLAKGKLSLEEFERTATAAVRTSIRTNMRSIYESWVLVKTASLLARRWRARLLYPENGSLLLERSGRQRSGGIPPNFVLYLRGLGALSFFLEAPRPVGWGDTRDLARAWKLYVALRPDMLVYSGYVQDIIRLGSDPPIERPDVIIEVKELPDWFSRSREVRGPFAAAMTAEEWRNRWIRGLWAGLADVLGVESPESAYEHVRRRKGLRLTEQQIVKLYARIYRPRFIFLVSREKVPGEVRAELEEAGVEVVDGVGFSEERLEPVAERLAEIASYRGVQGLPLFVPAEVLSRLERIAADLGVEPERVLEAAIRVAAENRDALREALGA